MEKQRTMPVLPVKAYTSQEWFDKEQEMIFGNTWQFAGLTEDIQNPHGANTVRTFQGIVKRVKDELVSNFVNDHLKAGDELEVMAPQGRFFAEIDKAVCKTYFLFAAGSGITPIIFILKIDSGFLKK